MASKDVQQLSDRDHVRSRFSMYISGAELDDHGRNPESLITAIREASDNSIDELISGNGNAIWISKDKATEPLGKEVYEDKSVKDVKIWYRYTVADTAGGIPIKATKDLSGQEVTMTELAVGSLRAGSKFDERSMEGLIGLNGVGVSATNFTSAEFSVYSHLSCHKLSETTEYVKSLLKKHKITQKDADDWYYKITYNLGLKVSEELVKIDSDTILQKFTKVKPSTVTTFIPDPTIHNSTDADLPVTFRYLKYLHPEFKFYVNWKEDKDLPPKYEFSDKVQIKRNVENIKNKLVTFNYSIGINKKLEAARDFSVNTLSTQHGTHERLFDNAWTEAFCDYFKNTEIAKYTGIGLNVLCVFQCQEPSFSSQTKERLSGVDGFKATESLPELVRSFKKVISSNEEAFKKYYDQVVEYFNARQNIGKLKELKKQLGDMASGANRSASAYLPKKLLDCSCKDRMKAELYICEGNSAGGGFVKARAGLDHVAVMPLRGKVLNTVGMDVNKALENAEISDITYVCGGVDDVHVPYEKLHYGKYIIAADADADGAQIGALLLGDLMQNHRFLFGTKENNYEDSRVYIAKAALYAFYKVDGTKDNKFFYAGQESQVADFRKKHKYKIEKRFKGLGECEPSELREMYINESTRCLLQVRPDNIDEALNLIDKTSKARQELMLNENVITSDMLELK